MFATDLRGILALLSIKERTLLVHLRESPGISGSDVEAIERELNSAQTA